MNDEQAKMIERARSTLRLGGVALQEKEANHAASEAYYAMFHAANALLASIDLGFSKHSAVHAAFGREFVKKGRIPQHLHRWLLSAFEIRVQATYDYDATVTAEEAEVLIEQAEQFVDAIEEYLSERAD